MKFAISLKILHAQRLIQGFANDISLFRSAGLSAIMLLQSEYQLEAIYKDEASVIRQNCSVYVYFPGGF